MSGVRRGPRAGPVLFSFLGSRRELGDFTRAREPVVRQYAKKKHRDCWVYARRRQTTMQGSFHTDADRGLAFAVPVDLVLVHHGSLACMLACPRCDTVNVHSLGYTHSAVWGHRACNAREATCAGYILRPAPVICKVSTPEWRRRVRGLIQQEKRQIRRGRSPNTDNVKK